MGLDMYLKARTYVNKLDYKDGESVERADYKQLASLYPALDNDQIYGFELGRTIAYWRKANQIHQWFVANVQNGEDDCREYYVGRNQLEKLLQMCKDVRLNRSLAEEMLPPQPGFFFGSTAIDGWYWEDLDLTVDQLTKILNDERLVDYDFYYQSSW